MKILCISDTHGLHNKINPIDLLSADMIIHAGDICNQGYIYEAEQFFKWFSGLNQYKYKIFIAGNHDWCFQTHPENIKLILKDYPDIIYLQDDEIIIEGIKFYGSPWQPEFYNWAFNLKRGKELQDKWDLISKDVNVLITHGPAYGLGDFVPYNNGENVGCKNLLDTCYNLNELKYHISGHIHYSYGEMINNNVNYINASICTERYEPINKPILIEI